jgi:hypothetical protein
MSNTFESVRNPVTVPESVTAKVAEAAVRTGEARVDYQTGRVVYLGEHSEVAQPENFTPPSFECWAHDLGAQVAAGLVMRVDN